MKVLLLGEISQSASWEIPTPKEKECNEAKPAAERQIQIINKFNELINEMELN